GQACSVLDPLPALAAPVPTSSQFSGALRCGRAHLSLFLTRSCGGPPKRNPPEHQETCNVGFASAAKISVPESNRGRVLLGAPVFPCRRTHAPRSICRRGNG